MPAAPPPDLSGRSVLIVTLGTRGDVQPFLALAGALQRCGAKPLLVVPPHYLDLCAEHSVPAESLLDAGEAWPTMHDLAAGAEENQEEFEERVSGCGTQTPAGWSSSPQLL